MRYYFPVHTAGDTCATRHWVIEVKEFDPPPQVRPGKHEMMTDCWIIVGPASKTLGQHYSNIGESLWLKLSIIRVMSSSPITQSHNLTLTLPFPTANFTTGVKGDFLAVWTCNMRPVNCNWQKQWRLVCFSIIWLCGSILVIVVNRYITVQCDTVWVNSIDYV